MGRKKTEKDRTTEFSHWLKRRLAKWRRWIWLKTHILPDGIGLTPSEGEKLTKPTKHQRDRNRREKDRSGK